jgi:hypothetical protein
MTQFKFKQVKKIFPSTFTKLMMPTDMINLVEKKGKYMSLGEIKQIQKFVDNWNERIKDIGTANFEYYAKRGKKSGVRLIPFDIKEEK